MVSFVAVVAFGGTLVLGWSCRVGLVSVSFLLICGAS